MASNDRETGPEALALERIDLDRVDSTNDEARRRLAAGLIATRGCITAREQTAGRGTHGRSWLSPRDAGIYLSYVIRNAAGATKTPLSGETPARPDLPLTLAYTLAAGVACVEAIGSVTGVEVRLKPVNDLLWRGRKLGGILTEAMIEDAAMKALIIGIGINLAPPDPAMTAAMQAVGLYEALAESSMGRLLPGVREPLIEHLIQRLQQWTQRVAAHEIDSVRAAWCRASDAEWPLATLGGQSRGAQ